METYASNPGNVKIHWPTYMKYHYVEMSVYWLVIPSFFFFISIKVEELNMLVGVAIALGVLYAMWWLPLKRHWKYGDVNPGVVISTKPFKVAVLANMSTDSHYEACAVKIISNPKPFGDIQIGDRFATVATYAGNINSEAWRDLEPRLVVTVTNNEATIQQTYDCIEPWRWRALQDAVLQIPNTKKFHCHRVDINSREYRMDDYSQSTFPDEPLPMPPEEQLRMPAQTIVAEDDGVVRFVCSDCGKKYKVPAAYRGKKARCKNCNTYNVIG